MKISIAMATYNGERYLREQLDSLRTQSRRPDELVITDDASTDATLNIVRAFSEEAPFDVRWYQNETNLGYARNFNRALMLTTGDIVFLCDQDDVWFPEKIAVVTDRMLRDADCLMVVNDAALTDEELMDLGFTKLDQIRSAGYPDSLLVMGCCMAVKRDLLELSLPVPEEFGSHDKWLSCIADGMEKKVLLETCLQFYRRHKDNSSQFIANRTQRVSRLQGLVERVRVVANAEQGAVGRLIAQRQLLISGCERAGTRAKAAQYSSALEHYCRELEREMVVLSRRKEIHEIPRLRRMRPVLRLWRDGQYSQKGAWKSVACDLFIK